MADHTAKQLDDVEPYSGPHAIAGIRFRPLGRALGVTAWGMNVLEIDAGCAGYPEHDHQRDGQEEVYVLIAGAATLRAGGEEIVLAPGAYVRVGAAEKRKLVPGQDGATLLVIGGTPGQAYQPRG